MRLLTRLLFAVLFGGLVIVAVPAPAADEPAKPEVGKPAPDFDLPAVNISKALPDAKDKKTLSLKDFQKGANAKNVVLFFFPKAMTRG
jgi:hypothetical protein